MPTVVEVLQALTLPLLLCGGVWFVVAGRLLRGTAAIDYEPRQPVPWDGLTTFTAAIIYLTVRAAVILGFQLVLRRDETMRVALEQAGDAAAQLAVPGFAAALFRAVAVGNIAAAAIVLCLLLVKSQAGLNDLGLSMHRLRSDVGLGIIAFLAIAPPVLLVQFALTQVVEPSQHPILLALGAGGDAEMLTWMVMTAVIVAPPVEEFLFRGVLQGWLERTVGDSAAASAVPIVASSFVFAAMHWENGVDVVALFFLSLGLGYLYRQTHRLWPGIVVHTLLNAFSMTAAIYGTTPT